MTPFFLDTGRHPITPSSLIATKEETRTQVEDVEKFLQQQLNSLQEAQENLRNAQERQAKYANQHRQQAPAFGVGQLVLLNNKNIINPPDIYRPKHKLLSKFIGPYKIQKKINEVAYQLELPHTMKIHNVFHVSLLKPYQSNLPEFEKR